MTTATPTDSERANMLVEMIALDVLASRVLDPTFKLENAVRRITSALADERERCAKIADRERKKSETLWQGVANLPVPNTSAMKVYNGRQLAAGDIAAAIRAADQQDAGELKL